VGGLRWRRWPRWRPALMRCGRGGHTPQPYARLWTRCCGCLRRGASRRSGHRGWPARPAARRHRRVRRHGKRSRSPGPARAGPCDPQRPCHGRRQWPSRVVLRPALRFPGRPVTRLAALNRLCHFLRSVGPREWRNLVLSHPPAKRSDRASCLAARTCGGCGPSHRRRPRQTTTATPGRPRLRAGPCHPPHRRRSLPPELPCAGCCWTCAMLKRSGDWGWVTTVKWLSGLSLCVCVRTCFVGCPKVRPPLPTESTTQIVPTGPSAPPSRAHTDAHALAPNRITPQIKNH